MKDIKNGKIIKNMQQINQRNEQTSSTPVVLAYGEVTGHKHAFYGDDTVELERIQEDGIEKTTLKVKEKDDLKHEEHTKHTVYPGTGIVEIQRELADGLLRRVED